MDRLEMTRHCEECSLRRSKPGFGFSFYFEFSKVKAWFASSLKSAPRNDASFFISKQQCQAGIHSDQRASGFTLIEILIALFIFTILSLMMMGGLRSVINIQSSMESNSKNLHQLQMALLVLSNDISQAVERPTTNAFGQDDKPFTGSTTSFAFTRMGFANPGNIARSVMVRVRFTGGNAFARATWDVLDLAPQSQAFSRILSKNVDEVSFEYLAENGRFYNVWPVPELANQALPRAVRINLSIPQWGRMSQLYVIPAQSNKQAATP